MGIQLDPNSLVKVGAKVQLGNLAKAVTEWNIGHGWDPSRTGQVDSDLWLVALVNGDAAELVRYDETDKTAIVTSPSGGLQYNGDDQTGAGSAGGDDETGVARLDKLRAIGVNQVLIVTNIYAPAITYGEVENAYVRIWPGNDESKAQAIQLTQEGKGARTVVFGWLEWTGPNDTDWEFCNQPAHANSIQEALAPFGVA